MASEADNEVCVMNHDGVFILHNEANFGLQRRGDKFIPVVSRTVIHAATEAEAWETLGKLHSDTVRRVSCLND